MRLQAHLCDIRGACCPRRRRCGACRPPRAYHLRHLYVHIAYAHLQLLQYTHSTTHRNRSAANFAEPAACGIVLSELVLRRVQGHAVVFTCRALCGGACIGAAHLHAYISALGPGLPSGLVLCVRRLVAKDVLGVFFSSSVPLIQRLAMAYTCVEPVHCIREECAQVT